MTHPDDGRTSEVETTPEGLTLRITYPGAGSEWVQIYKHDDKPTLFVSRPPDAGDTKGLGLVLAVELTRAECRLLGRALSDLGER